MVSWLRPTACAAAAAALGLALVLVVVNLAATPHAGTDTLPRGAALPLLPAIAAPACVGLFVALRRPRNRIAWILLLGALSVALVMVASEVAAAALYHHPESRLGAWAATVGEVWVAFFLWPLALAYAYPGGRWPTGRWRWLARFAAANGALGVLLLIFAREHDGPYGRVPTPLPLSIPVHIVAPLFWATFFGLVAALLGGALVLRARYRAGGAVERRQILWLAYGVLLLPIWLGVGYAWSWLIGSFDVVDGLGLATLQIWPAVAVGVAVTRHGLYSIDRLVNRTLVYAALTVLLVATYAATALLAGRLASDSALTASLATLAAALAFRPLRDRLQRGVDRRFARARFEATRLLGAFLDDVREGRAEPEDVGAAIAAALGDPTAEVLFRLPETGAYADRRGQLVDVLPARERATIGRDLGVLLHAPGSSPDVLRATLAAAAVPVELARLRVELRLQLAEVEASRARIALAGYEERRRIERDLHDGAQQRLVTLGIVLRRLQRSLPREAQLLGPAFDAAVGEVAAAIADLRTLAAGVRPPRLDEGLAAALADLARGAALPVDVIASGDRAPPEVEATAYFVACEALTNAVKHASASRVVVESARQDGVLRLHISDDGVGGAAPGPGSGLRGMRDRVAAQGGTLGLESPAGAGTRIAVELPCAS